MSSADLHVVEFAFKSGFDSFRAHQLLKSITYRLNHLSVGSSHSLKLKLQSFILSSMLYIPLIHLIALAVFV